MNFKKGFKKVKKWVKENKGKLLVGAGILTAAVVVTMANKGETEAEESEAQKVLEAPKEFDHGKDLEMHFIDPENGEVLWKEGCSEYYMNQMKDIGMEFEETRKLNGIEEA